MMNKELYRVGDPKYASARTKMIEHMRKTSEDVASQREDRWMEGARQPKVKDARLIKPIDEVSKVASMSGHDMRRPAVEMGYAIVEL